VVAAHLAADEVLLGAEVDLQDGADQEVASVDVEEVDSAAAEASAEAEARQEEEDGDTSSCKNTLARAFGAGKEFWSFSAPRSAVFVHFGMRHGSSYPVRNSLTVQNP